MSKKSVLVAVTATLALGGLAACGDDEESEASSSALTDTELASEAEAICKEHNDAIQAGFEEEGLKADPDPVQVRTVVKDYVLPHYTAWIGQQDTLEPPEDMAADWDTWITDSTAARDAIKEDPNTAFDPAAFEGVNGQAEAMGLSQECFAGPTA